MESVEAMVTAIEEFEGAVILVTHAEWVLSRLPERLVICRDFDRLVFEGTYDHFLEKIGWGRAFGGRKSPKAPAWKRRRGPLSLR